MLDIITLPSGGVFIALWVELRVEMTILPKKKGLSNSAQSIVILSGGVDRTRTGGLLRDRQAF